MRLWPRTEPKGRAQVIEHLRTDHALWAEEMNNGSFERMTDMALVLSHESDHRGYQGEVDHTHRLNAIAVATGAVATLLLLAGVIYVAVWIAS